MIRQLIWYLPRLPLSGDCLRTVDWLHTLLATLPIMLITLEIMLSENMLYRFA